MTQLTDNQRALLLLAVATEGRIENFPDNLKGGARAAVTRGLLTHGLVEAQGAGYALTDAGYEAVGAQRPGTGQAAGDGDCADDSNQDTDDADSEAEAEGSGDDDGNVAIVAAKPTAPPKQRKETRIDQVVALLLRPQGATIAEVMKATDWQQHSVRGFFAGTLKKKGHTVINTKEGKEERVYRILTEVAKEAKASAAARDEEE
ncbi:MULTISPECIES: DUF3489 domain-containing protein [unclassified Lysobacter]|uniref:DUF3489 domain-containing protein n=1 Tax=unclassified Lysobacter TaxID=2635362 RepID=UPI001BEC0D74|nr:MULTISPECIES: DUF3489 domain-containing protein [unclassified Lysobacter]MBT2746183.1 DUF3489 domain-containing protein [Lysobacter sp. ISL-42]MBT2750728.1 DUF3489 domain-containing protein [Lysobacter sp. ISL-50]MBT2776125.1 DUF3489 domain-containing protein [Lysobacter sp. ISL-54]MBT2784631.1 DUF3489 domain-containing protein [Lysobacter sp. ISL-52]